VIQVYRPSQEIEEILSRDGPWVPVTDVRLVDGRVETHIQLNGQPRMFTEDPDSVLSALRVTGATLADVEFRDGIIYYTLAQVDQAYMIPGVLEEYWLNRDHRLWTLTGARLAGDGVDYDVLDAGRPDVKHETVEWVLSALRVTGVRLAGVEFRDGNVYYTLAASS
jgi:hypothetical protein